jgi:two-component system, NarL family, invasion response regulator UvrY
MDKVIKIVVADDHAVVHEGLARIFERTDNMCIVAHYENGNDLIFNLHELDADIVLLDIDMPGNFIIENIKEIRSIRKDISIIVFSISPDYQFAKRVMSAGAKSYINKNCDPELLVEKIKSIYYGKATDYSGVTKIYKNNPVQNDCESMLSFLTSRELCIIRLIAQGKNITEISEKLFVSKHTVYAHKKNIIQKLGLKNTLELVIFAVRNRVVD